MKLKSLFFSILSILIAAGVSGQINYTKTSEYLNANKYWPVSDYSGISFFDGTAKVDTSALLRGSEAFGSICHPVTGKLLFYADHGQLYNANHRLMLNGDVGRYDANTNDRSIVNQSTFAYSSLIVPYIGDSNLYYHFYYSKNVPGNNKLLYSIIDMRLDGGNGGVVAGRKNVVLDSMLYLGEGLNVLMGDNCDLWLVALEINPGHFSFSPSYLRAYHITESGVESTPVISIMETSAFWAYLTPSHDRKLIAQTGWLANGVEIFNFDAQTGNFSTKYTLPIEFGFLFGGPITASVRNAAFSPDNSKMYVDYIEADLMQGTSSNVTVLQFDLSKEHVDSIFNSRKNIHIYQDGINISALRSYNDTIYILRQISGKMSIDRYSNLNGKAEDVVFESDVLTGKSTIRSSTFNYEAIYPNQFIIQTIDTQLCAKELTIQSSDINGADFLWSDGSTGNTITVTEAGTYWVQSRTHLQHCFTYVADTFHVSFLPPVYEPVISVNLYELSTQPQADASYQWILNGQEIEGATDEKYMVKENGDYQVRVTSTLPGECSAVSAVYKVTNYTSIHTLTPDAVSVYPNPVSNFIYIETSEAIRAELLDVAGRVILSSHDKKINVQKMAGGYYQLLIYNLQGLLIHQAKVVKK